MLNKDKTKANGWRTFASFKKRSQVIDEYDLYFENKNFVKEKGVTVSAEFLERLNREFVKPGVFNSEYSICEAIIYPILSEVSAFNELIIWSHYKLEAPEVKLTGEPDYLFALSKRGDDDYDKAIVCVGEAKKDKFTDGWAQVSAEMVAAQKLNKNDDIPIYGIVTTGKLWEFAVLKGNIYTHNTLDYTVLKDLDTVLNILNWMFSEGKKNADILKNSLKV